MDLYIHNAQIRAIKVLLKKGYKVILRPRFRNENIDYSFLGSNLESKLEIDKSISPEYICTKSKYIISGQSSIGIEAYLYGCRVLTVNNQIKPITLNKMMENYLTFNHPNNPESVEEMLEIIENKSKYNDDAKFTNRIRSFFGEIDGSSFSKVSNELLKATKNNESVFYDSTKSKIYSRGIKNLSTIKRIMINKKHAYLSKIIAFVLIKLRVLNNFIKNSNPNS